MQPVYSSAVNSATNKLASWMLTCWQLFNVSPHLCSWSTGDYEKACIRICCVWGKICRHFQVGQFQCIALLMSNGGVLAKVLQASAVSRSRIKSGEWPVLNKSRPTSSISLIATVTYNLHAVELIPHLKFVKWFCVGRQNHTIPSISQILLHKVVLYCSVYPAPSHKPIALS